MQNVPVEATPDLKYETLNLIIAFKEEEKQKLFRFRTLGQQSVRRQLKRVRKSSPAKMRERDQMLILFISISALHLSTVLDRSETVEALSRTVEQSINVNAKWK